MPEHRYYLQKHPIDGGHAYSLRRYSTRYLEQGGRRVAMIEEGERWDAVKRLWVTECAPEASCRLTGDVVLTPSEGLATAAQLDLLVHGQSEDEPSQPPQ